jgi:membrane fusion protein (multidrug efflux system)
MVTNTQTAAVPGTPYTPWYRNRYALISAGAACLLLTAAITGAYFKSRSHVYTDNAIVEGTKISVGPKYAGKIEKLYVAAGAMAHKGDPLVQMDVRELSAQEKQAEADAACADGKLKLSEIDLEKAQGDFKRTELQFSNKLIPAEQYEHGEKDLAALTTRRAIAAAQLASAKAQLEMIRAQLASALIRAPQDGVVAKKWYSAGDVVQAGQPIFTLYDLRDIKILANVEEDDFHNVRVGQKAVITLDAYPGREFNGTVASLGPNTASEFAPGQASNSTGEFTKLTQYIPVRITLNAASGNDIAASAPLLPGMSAEARLIKSGE